MTSLSATSTTRAASIADTLSTTEFTAVSISSPHWAMGESCSTDFSLFHFNRFFCPLFINTLKSVFDRMPLSCLLSNQPETPGCSVHEGHSQQGQRGSCHRQGRHAHSQREGEAQAQGEYNSQPLFGTFSGPFAVPEINCCYNVLTASNSNLHCLNMNSWIRSE